MAYVFDMAKDSFLHAFRFFVLGLGLYPIERGRVVLPHVHQGEQHLLK